MQKKYEDRRPDNLEIENENMREPSGENHPPRPATEPKGAAWSERGDKTQTDPGSGEPRESQKERHAPDADHH